MQPFPLAQLVAIVAAFLSAALIAGLAVSRLLSTQAPERRRLKELSRPAPVAQDDDTGRPAAKGRTRRRVAQGGWLPKSVRDMSQTERRLATAGYHSPATARSFIVAQYALPVLLGLLGFAAFGGAGRNAWIAGGFLAIVGYLAPGLVIDRLIAKRRLQIRNGLPDVLDLLIVCLEAGNSLDQAVVKASDELALAYPALAEELRTLTTETRAGKPRLEAFRNLAQRTKVDDVRSLVAMLVQTDRFGTSVSQALRTLADGMRAKRRQAAEEAANKVGVKLVFPLVLCLFPAFFIVILGPAFLSIMKALGGVGR